MYNKAKGQQPPVGKPELLALCVFRGGVAERSNATGLQPANGAINTVQGSESLPRRQNNYAAPAMAVTTAGAEIRTAKAVQTFRVHYPASGCASQGESSRDLPQLPDRMQTLREASQWTTAVSVRPVR
jgi:hypothetical protein